MPDNKPVHLPPSEYLNECFSYDKETGALAWKTRPLHHFKNAHGMNTFNAKFAGSACENLVNGRYFSVVINENRYLAHRVIWKMVTGEDPAKNIDHIDTNKRNNRFSNLRIATKQENAFNQGKTARNKTGFKGVSYDKTRGKFFACIRVEGRTKPLGRFTTAEQASAAYVSAAKEIQGVFAHSTSTRIDL